MTRPAQTDDAGALVELEASARAEVVLPADAHVIGEPVAVTHIRSSGVARAGLLATCKRGDATYELSLADVVFPAASAGAFLVARYRTWLGLAPFVASESHPGLVSGVSADEPMRPEPVLAGPAPEGEAPVRSIPERARPPAVLDVHHRHETR